MKALLLLAFVAALAYAEAPPEYLRDGKIVVTLKSGKTYEYSTNEWMVVRRGKRILLPPLAASRSTYQEHFDQPEHLRNRVRVQVGAGQNGMAATQIGSTLRVENQYTPVVSLSYDHSISNEWSLGASFYSNGTCSVGVGYDF